MLASIAFDLSKLLESYPTGYVWSELLINYQGGFVRRGAFGEVVLRLWPMITPLWSSAIVLTVLYLAFVWFAVRLFRFMDMAMILLFVFSPGLFAFWIWDYGVFGRKEIVAMVLYMALVDAALTAWRENPGRRGLVARYVGLNILLLFVSLVHELVVFFIPFYLVILRLSDSRGLRRLETVLQGATLVVVPAMVFLAMFALRTENAAQAIAASWEALFPHLTFAPDAGALHFFSMTMAEGISISLHVMRTSPTNWHYLILGVLSLLPLVYMLPLCRSGLGRFRAAGWWNRMLLLGCLMLPLVLFCIGMDYGRWVNQIIFHWYVLMVFLAAKSDILQPLPGDTVIVWSGYSMDRSRYVIVGIVLSLILSCIGMRHFVTAGDSPIAWLPLRMFL
ncbi:hypothetical protein [Desulfovibrio sp. TomC]|uniref:hypothetical protein n=1 Tax=Desulfovibrio sp. TomC TaxID=1562888 RepID=UPI0012E31593|nr:hypothetical protein [Desulfovibrio sp. TomC]